MLPLLAVSGLCKQLTSRLKGVSPKTHTNSVRETKLVYTLLHTGELHQLSNYKPSKPRGVKKWEDTHNTHITYNNTHTHTRPTWACRGPSLPPRSPLWRRGYWPGWRERPGTTPPATPPYSPTSTERGGKEREGEKVWKVSTSIGKPEPKIPTFNHLLPSFKQQWKYIKWQSLYMSRRVTEHIWLMRWHIEPDWVDH